MKQYSSMMQYSDVLCWCTVIVGISNELRKLSLRLRKVMNIINF